MACTKFASGRVMVALFYVILVELARASGASCTKPTLMVNSTFVALSTTSEKLLCEAVKSISW